jgi:PAS domain S-box-containing protein
MGLPLQQARRSRKDPAPSAPCADEAFLARVHPAEVGLIEPVLRWLGEAPREATLRLRLRVQDGWIPTFVTLSSHCGESGLELKTNADEIAAAWSAERGLRDIVEGSAQGLMVMREGKTLYVNAAQVRMLGLSSPQEILSRPDVMDFAHPEDRAMLRGYAAARLAGGSPPTQYEFRALRADGAVIWLEGFASMIVWEGAPAILVAFTDITSRKRTEDALRRSERLLATVFQSSPDALSLTTHPQGRFVDVNDAFLELSGYVRDEIVGRTSTELASWVDAVARVQFLEEVGRRGVVRDLVAQMRDRDGRIRDCSLSAELFRFEDQDLLLCATRDIGERRRQEIELRQSKEAAELANRSKSEFLANMSHELRTPLNAIMGFSEIIRQQQFGSIGQAKYLEYASDIHASGEHLLKIINDILDLSKIEAGRFELRDDAVSSADLVGRCIRLIRGRAAAAGIELEVDVPPHTPRLRADERAFMQVLINLLSNAVKFTPEGGRVAVRAALAPDGGFELCVMDTGIGMSEAEIAVALTPFGQNDNVLARKHHGTGLGLPLAKSLVELHGGRLTIESAPGQGVAARASFPAERILPT